jgi:hypothetical protein
MSTADRLAFGFWLGNIMAGLGMGVIGAHIALMATRPQLYREQWMLK